ncbi:MAG: HD domain-containing protein [Chloroflexi bacterium]|nr:HD domain-containing protein [Chloroflexota bacterium]MDA8187989.1 HD domain-containing protein [Dehalococcoidales bacterium]
MSAAYRVRQFIGALRASVEPRELDILDEHLRPALKALFLAMDIQDQRHTLDVFRYLVNRGCRDRTLLQAALLHDVGKANAGLGTWYRVAIVLFRAFCPALLAKLSSAESRGWRRPFWVHKHHGEAGARLVAQAGGDYRLVEMVRLHQSPADDPLLQALCEADGAN